MSNLGTGHCVRDRTQNPTQRTIAEGDTNPNDRIQDQANYWWWQFGLGKSACIADRSPSTFWNPRGVKHNNMGNNMMDMASQRNLYLYHAKSYSLIQPDNYHFKFISHKTNFTFLY